MQLNDAYLCLSFRHPVYKKCVTMMKPGNPKLRMLCTVWAFLECLGFGGLLYGWGSLVYVLKEEGLYLDLCDNVQGVTATNNSAHAVYSDVNTAGNITVLINPTR